MSKISETSNILFNRETCNVQKSIKQLRTTTLKNNNWLDAVDATANVQVDERVDKDVQKNKFVEISRQKEEGNIWLLDVTKREGNEMPQQNED